MLVNRHQFTSAETARGNAASNAVKKSRPSKRKPLNVAVVDCETDPFSGPGNVVSPFAWGFYDGTVYHHWYGDDATRDFIHFIRSLEETHIIYAHNGGKFDFTFILEHLEEDIFCIGTRIVKGEIIGYDGTKHQIRDSFSIIPEALDFASEKTKIDYSIMSKAKRNKPENVRIISDYLKDDCTLLYKYVEAFRSEFGDTLTMASASMKKLNLSMRGRRKGRIMACYQRLTPEQDDEIRPYYYGGHVECFKRGIFIDGPYTLYDINSSYANVMRNFLHPTSSGYTKGLHHITDKTDFCLIDATSDGALPIRNLKTKELLFPHGRFLFQATGFEVRMALNLGLLRIHKLHDAWEAHDRTSFADFIDHYYRVRLEARAAGNQIYSLFWKRVMNGAYGKFAQNPRKFTDTKILHIGDEPPGEGWEIQTRYRNYDVYTRQSDQERAWRSYLNVGTGASITGAARAELLKGIHSAQDVLYCDTDSIIAKGFTGLSDPKQLGAWKVETVAHTVAIADKKMYAMLGEPENDKERETNLLKYGNEGCVKLASKGVRATAQDILNLAEGRAVSFVPLAPTIKIDGSQIWTTRTLTRRDLPSRVPPVLSERSQDLTSI